MTRICYDSVTAADIPANARMVAGYISGPYAWSPADWARFPDAVQVRIATQALVNDGHVLDVEAGDASPAQAPGWVQMRRKAGVDPTVYCSLGNWQMVRACFAANGILQPHFWIAAYDNVPTIPPGAVAKQYANAPLAGGHFDLSIVANVWPGVDKGGTDMLLVRGTTAVYLIMGDTVVHVDTPADEQAFQAAGVPQATISDAMLQSILQAGIKAVGSITGNLTLS
jgi:hypothetical protein